MKKTLQKIYLMLLKFIDSTRFMKAHHQILSIIVLKESIELNVNTDMMIKNVRLVELNISIATDFLNMQNFKDDFIEYKCLL